MEIELEPFCCVLMHEPSSGLCRLLLAAQAIQLQMLVNQTNMKSDGYVD